MQHKQTTGRTAIYCRISLDATGDELGVERQERECREYAERQGWAVPKELVFIDNDISATTGKVRPAFEQLLATPLERIIVWHTDRLARKTADLERVIDKGTPVHAVTAGHLDLATPAGRAVARTITAWATYEGEQKSLRQQASHRQRAEQGRPFWGHRRPFGYNVDGSKHPQEAPALAACFDRYRKGETFADLARWLTGQGFTTSQGATWTGSRLARLMRDARNAGLISYHEEIVGRGNWEPIITEDEWRAIVARAKTLPKQPNKGGAKIKSLLGGIMRCEENGEPFKQTKQATGRRIYQCPCHCVSVDADWADQYVGQEVGRYATSPTWNLLQAYRPTEQQAATAAREATELRQRLDELTTMYVEGEIDSNTLKRGRAQLEEKISAAERQALPYYMQNPIEQELGSIDVWQLWQDPDALNLTQRREIVAMMFDSITVRTRKNRNERVSADMFTISRRDPSHALPQVEQQPSESV